MHVVLDVTAVGRRSKNAPWEAVPTYNAHIEYYDRLQRNGRAFTTSETSEAISRDDGFCAIKITGTVRMQSGTLETSDGSTRFRNPNNGRKLNRIYVAYTGGGNHMSAPQLTDPAGLVFHANSAETIWTTEYGWDYCDLAGTSCCNVSNWKAKPNMGSDTWVNKTPAPPTPVTEPPRDSPTDGR
jgi:hypothetical protein